MFSGGLRDNVFGGEGGGYAIPFFFGKFTNLNFPGPDPPTPPSTSFDLDPSRSCRIQKIGNVRYIV